MNFLHRNCWLDVVVCVLCRVGGVATQGDQQSHFGYLRFDA
jgi:hypothetical protein